MTDEEIAEWLILNDFSIFTWQTGNDDQPVELELDLAETTAVVAKIREKMS